MSREKTFTLSLSVDATTVDDVERLIADDGGWARILEDWNLIDPHLSGTVTDNQEIAERMAKIRADRPSSSLGETQEVEP